MAESIEVARRVCNGVLGPAGKEGLSRCGEGGIQRDRLSAGLYGEVVLRKDVQATFPGASFGTDQGVDCEPAELEARTVRSQ